MLPPSIPGWKLKLQAALHLYQWFCIIYKMELRRCGESPICVWRAEGRGTFVGGGSFGQGGTAPAPYPPYAAAPGITYKHEFRYVNWYF